LRTLESYFSEIMCIESRQLWANWTLVRYHIGTESATNVGHENFRQRLDWGNNPRQLIPWKGVYDKSWQGLQDLSWEGVQDLSWTSLRTLESYFSEIMCIESRQLWANWTLVRYHIGTESATSIGHKNFELYDQKCST
jgi:hypothetical protein